MPPCIDGSGYKNELGQCSGQMVGAYDGGVGSVDVLPPAKRTMETFINFAGLHLVPSAI